MVDGRGLRFNIWMVDHLAAGLYIFIGEPEHTSLIKIHKLLTNFVIYSNKTNTIKKKRELKLNCRGKAIDKKRIKMKSRKLRHSIHFLGQQWFLCAIFATAGFAITIIGGKANSFLPVVFWTFTVNPFQHKQAALELQTHFSLCFMRLLPYMNLLQRLRPKLS